MLSANEREQTGRRWLLTALADECVGFRQSVPPGVRLRIDSVQLPAGWTRIDSDGEPSVRIDIASCDTDTGFAPNSSVLVFEFDSGFEAALKLITHPDDLYLLGSESVICRRRSSGQGIDCTYLAVYPRHGRELWCRAAYYLRPGPSSDPGVLVQHVLTATVAQQPKLDAAMSAIAASVETLFSGHDE